MAIQLEIREADVRVLADGAAWLELVEPFRVCVLGHEPRAAGYEAVDEGTWVATASIEAPDGTHVELVDRWSVVDDDTVQVDRRAVVRRAGSSPGVRVELRVDTAAPDAGGHDDWQFFIPGSMYNRNDTDHDGAEDYLGTYTQDFRDDRLASLAVLAYLPRAGRYAALTRADLPEHDTAVSAEDMRARHFVQATDIGSLGLAPAPGGGQVTLRASYPFSEEHSFCLNMAGDGWAAYLPNREAQAIEVSYRLRTARAVDLTEAIWDITRHQMDALGTRTEPTAFSLEESLAHRTLLTQQYYREWTAKENAAQPAGYLVHFSPRSGRTNAALLEFGFSGAQTLLAYTSIQSGHDMGVPLWISRARRVIDFFIRECQLDNGFSHGLYDTDAQDFAYWFTGILLPFQYSTDAAQVQRYLGRQVAAALMPIARELRELKGNYTRTMCESMYPILLAYRIEREHGNTHPEWLTAGRRFGDFLLRTQAPDGSWNRAYDAEGAPILHPAQWFGAGDIERKSGTIFPIGVLTTLCEITGDSRYLDAAARAGDFIIATYVDPVEYVGGLNDTTHIKSVKTDSVGVMFVMRSLIKLHALTGDPRHLEGAAKAARILSSWVYLWNVPMPAGSLLGRAGFKSTGWAVCDVIPGGSYLDNELLEFTGDLVDVAARVPEERLFDIAELAGHGMQYALSTPHEMLGYVAPGIQCEGVMTAYWLSDPEQTEFSGAVNKVKGDDNDTANGLTNGQAAHALFELRERYGTADFTALRAQLFR